MAEFDFGAMPEVACDDAILDDAGLAEGCEQWLEYVEFGLRRRRQCDYVGGRRGVGRDPPHDPNNFDCQTISAAATARTATTDRS